ncbi:MAG: hypothetical protein OXT72_15170 [Gammaproteobacteria bacterium]|nr:hypothetical protein [Gammaproteobacteria bacterium]MDE0248365.1 hypothetical protein [Gammaproteobacteria bacterium]
MLDSHSPILLDAQLKSYHDGRRRLDEYDALVAARLHARQDRIDLLTKSPGVDRSSAQSILVEFSPCMTEFSSHRHFAA